MPGEQLRQEFLEREAPLRPQPVHDERPVEPSPIDAPRRPITILLVEAQETVRGLTRDLLQRHGYTVLEAPDALTLCKTQKGSIHLLITDVAKPGTIGLELAGRLTLMRPEMKVLYLSGYLNDMSTHRALLNRGIAFLPRPFTPDTLVSGNRRHGRRLRRNPKFSPSIHHSIDRPNMLHTHKLNRQRSRATSICRQST